MGHYANMLQRVLVVISKKLTLKLARAMPYETLVVGIFMPASGIGGGGGGGGGDLKLSQLFLLSRLRSRFAS